MLSGCSGSPSMLADDVYTGRDCRHNANASTAITGWARRQLPTLSARSTKGFSTEATLLDGGVKISLLGTCRLQPGRVGVDANRSVELGDLVTQQAVVVFGPQQQGAGLRDVGRFSLLNRPTEISDDRDDLPPRVTTPRARVLPARILKQFLKFCDAFSKPLKEYSFRRLRIRLAASCLA